MTPEEFQARLRTALDDIEVREEPWQTSSRRRRVRRRGRRIALVAFTVSTAAVVVAGVGFAAVHLGQRQPGPIARVGASESAASPVHRILRTAVVKGPRVNASMARQSGFLVYIGGKDLLGPTLSSTRVEGGNSRWSASQNEAVVLASIPGQAFWSPSVNPARTRVVFVAGPGAHVGAFAGEGDLVLANIDGSDPRIVTNGESDADPTWSPDGRQIAFLRGGSIWAMSADGTHQRSLGVALDAHSLAWSPDGKKFAVGSGNAPERIAIINIRSRTFRWLTPRGVEQYQPAWSPDGKQLVYGQTGPNAIFISNTNGTGVRQLTTCKPPKCTQDVEPVWSPDGSEIAFVQSVYGVQQIATVPANGGSVTLLTSGPDQHNLPSW